MKRRRLFAGGFFFILSSCVQKIKGGAVRKNAKVQGADEKSCKENEKNCEPGDVNKAKPNGDKAEGSEEDGIGEMPSETTVKPQDGVEQDLAGLVVTLDVGHSPKPDPGTPLPWDLGAAGHGVDEHEENHFVAKRTSELLKARGAKVYVLFYPRIVTLTSRGQGGKGSVFISIHHNAAANPEAQGTEVLNDSERTTQKDRRLARIIQEKIVKIMWQGKDKEGDVKVDRGNKNMGLTVLRNVPAGVEACCLSEAYFVSGNTVTPAKARHWSTLEAEALVEGIADYWKSRNSPSLALAGEAPFPPSENPEQYAGH